MYSPSRRGREADYPYFNFTFTVRMKAEWGLSLCKPIDAGREKDSLTN